MRPATDAAFMTGRTLTVGMQRAWAVVDTDIAIDAGSLDAPEVIAAGSWIAPRFEACSFSAYPSGALRYD